MLAALEKVVLLAVDAEKGDGPALAKEHKVRGYPTFVLLNAEGLTVDRWIGYAKNHFLKTLGDALKDTATIDSKKARFKENPSAADAEVLGRYSSAIGEYKDAVDYYRSAMELDKGSGRNHLFDIFENTCDGYKREMFAFAEVLDAAEKVIANDEADAASKVQTAVMITPLIIENSSMGSLEKFIEAGITAAGNDGSLAGMKTQLIIDRCIYISGDTAKAIELKKRSMPENWRNDPSQLNNFAWWCFEHGFNLKEAEKLSRRGVKLAKPGREKAMIADTVAEICFARKNKKEAIKFARLAAAEDPDNQFYKKQIERFMGDN